MIIVYLPLFVFMYLALGCFALCDNVQRFLFFFQCPVF